MFTFSFIRFKIKQKFKGEAYVKEALAADCGCGAVDGRAVEERRGEADEFKF